MCICEPYSTLIVLQDSWRYEEDQSRGRGQRRGYRGRGRGGFRGRNRSRQERDRGDRRQGGRWGGGRGKKPRDGHVYSRSREGWHENRQQNDQPLPSRRWNDGNDQDVDKWDDSNQPTSQLHHDNQRLPSSQQHHQYDSSQPSSEQRRQDDSKQLSSQESHHDDSNQPSSQQCHSDEDSDGAWGGGRLRRHQPSHQSGGETEESSFVERRGHQRRGRGRQHKGGRNIHQQKGAWSNHDRREDERQEPGFQPVAKPPSKEHSTAAERRGPSDGKRQDDRTSVSSQSGSSPKNEPAQSPQRGKKTLFVKKEASNESKPGRIYSLARGKAISSTEKDPGEKGGSPPIVGRGHGSQVGRSNKVPGTARIKMDHGQSEDSGVKKTTGVGKGTEEEDKSGPKRYSASRGGQEGTGKEQVFQGTSSTVCPLCVHCTPSTVCPLYTLHCVSTVHPPLCVRCTPSTVCPLYTLHCVSTVHPPLCVHCTPSTVSTVP